LSSKANALGCTLTDINVLGAYVVPSIYSWGRAPDQRESLARVARECASPQSDGELINGRVVHKFNYYPRKVPSAQLQ
jgi:hypothetical protein